ncbi:MAG: hypothetical protein EBS31_05795 [Burkholderiaceae bacterium]|jgi:hypothetical protein|uniref:hypothetical protein n=1 Tax=Polynucleobacter sp. MWH-Loch1C5 TaxID=2689108 RepID=UPI001C0DE1E5|nr:hypothetical protein [Polynucleobacter sp. MWH-Loch1C5]MBU3541719.1 hypothetical protein [Polynucleobacter sp. MWH-Loch1C5]NBV00941.1 hypothetical protein [Burkholderiaceae bacterium]
MKHKFLVLLFLPLAALAGPAEEAELADLETRQENLNLQKDWAKYRWDKKQHDCYSRFFVNRCLDEARLVYREEIKAIRAQETPLKERQRVLKAIQKDERDQQREAERLSEEKARERQKNVETFEQKQIDMQARQQDVEKRRQDSEKRANENKKATPF